jgi:hypothetical protein
MSKSVAADGPAVGRYLYCLVSLDGACETGDDGSPRLDTTGIEGAPVRVVESAAAPVGAVVHPRREPFDSTDLTELRDWLLAHQRVVDAAGDRFGTPLPVRFDTVLEGDDDAVAAWLGRNADQIAAAFDDVAGCWEYRVTLSWDSTAFESEQRTTDATLSEIDSRLDQCGEGKQFLLEKQYEQRVRELVRERRAALKSGLVDRLAEESREVTERPVRSDAAASLDVELDDDAVAQVALLAPPDEESAIGSALDEVAATPGVDVRFTGPWPPYTFTTQITDDA